MPGLMTCQNNGKGGAVTTTLSRFNNVPHTHTQINKHTYKSCQIFSLIDLRETEDFSGMCTNFRWVKRKENISKENKTSVTSYLTQVFACSSFNPIRTEALFHCSPFSFHLISYPKIVDTFQFAY